MAFLEDRITDLVWFAAQCKRPTMIVPSPNCLKEQNILLVDANWDAALLTVQPHHEGQIALTFICLILIPFYRHFARCCLQ